MNTRGQEHDPLDEEAVAPHGLFDIINNYLLLFYASACYLMYSSLSTMFLLSDRLTILLPLAGLVAVVGPLMMISVRSPRRFRDDFAFRRTGTAMGIAALLAAASAIIPMEAFSVIFQRNLVHNADYINLLITIKSKGPVTFIVVGIHLIAIAPLSEELLFRGFIQQIFARNMPTWLAVVLAGLVFGLAHFNLSIIPAATVMGIFFGYLFVRTGSILVPIAAHSLFNIFSFVMLTLSSKEELLSKDVSSPDLRIVALSATVLVASLFLIESHTHYRAK